MDRSGQRIVGILNLLPLVLEARHLGSSTFRNFIDRKCLIRSGSGGLDEPSELAHIVFSLH